MGSTTTQVAQSNNKELLLKYLFEEVQVSRLCLLPKALAISLLFDCETCVVVDSGATSTSVWVVMDGKVDTTRTRTVPVGGLHVRSHRGRGRGVYYGAGGHRDGGAQEFTEVN